MANMTHDDDDEDLPDRMAPILAAMHEAGFASAEDFWSHIASLNPEGFRPIQEAAAALLEGWDEMMELIENWDPSDD